MNGYGFARLGACALLASLAIASYGAPARADEGSAPYEGTWRLSYDSGSEIDIELAYRHDQSSWDEGHTVQFAQSGVQGVTLDQLRSASGDERFSIVRDAGTFDCRGYFKDGVGSGIFAFRPSSAYADALAARGLGRPSIDDEFRLAF